MPSHRPAFRSRAPSVARGITHLGDERVHRIHVACIYLVARCKLGSDLSRHHRAIGAAQHVKDTATAPVLIDLVFVVLGFGFAESGYALLKTGVLLHRSATGLAFGEAVFFPVRPQPGPGLLGPRTRTKALPRGPKLILPAAKSATKDVMIRRSSVGP